MSRVFWDTNLFVYLFEGSGESAVAVRELRERMLSRGDELCTSTLTLGEILVKPLELGNTELARRIEESILASARVIPFDADAARTFASIRAEGAIRPADAIQLACAAQVRADLFITNDERLSRRLVPGIQFVSSLARAPI
ncbi:MAG TPA: PIN domain-containing protein [Chloroflexota bacterium]